MCSLRSTSEIVKEWLRININTRRTGAVTMTIEGRDRGVGALTKCRDERLLRHSLGYWGVVTRGEKKYETETVTGTVTPPKEAAQPRPRTRKPKNSYRTAAFARPGL
jgi:hypothetical protein